MLKQQRVSEVHIDEWSNNVFVTNSCMGLISLLNPLTSSEPIVWVHGSASCHFLLG